ncbi:uncharacterized protein [Panulirus ornatus]|uniref:uncharacterized protein n=1 Tax=Panulirus ornatus TaxID=150431 RepID=UPI003A84590A
MMSSTTFTLTLLGLLACGVWASNSGRPNPRPLDHSSYDASFQEPITLKPSAARTQDPWPRMDTKAKREHYRKSRDARPRVDFNARKEYYSKKFRELGCTPQEPPPNQPPLPTVPKSFMTELEITFLDQDKPRVMYGREMYESPTMRGVLDYLLVEEAGMTYPSVIEEVIHYNILFDEALFILTDDGCSASGEEECTNSKYCTAGKISDLSTELQYLFGIESTSGSGTFMGAAGILEFGKQFNYTAQPSESSCHGLKCQIYETCLILPEEEASVQYLYYWSTKDWNMQNNKDQVPIAVEIFGHGKFGGHTLHDVAIRYDFFDFRREWMPSRYQLEPPADTYCVNRVTHLKPPKTVTMFSFKSELVIGFDVFVPDGENQTLPIRLRGMFPKNEWYDWDMRITRQEFVPFYIGDRSRRFENLTSEIHEFNQGLSYIIRPRQSFCKIKRIENITSWGDVMVGPDGSVTIQSPWNYESLDEPMQYNGVHWERGMETDVWAGIKTNKLTGLNETIVWYFASPMTNEILGRLNIQTTDKVPIKQEKYLTKEEGLPHVIYNIYGYDSKVPTTHKHDISLCYGQNQMRHFVFDLPANAFNKTFNMRENLKYAVVEALSEAGKVSPLRINRIEVRKATSAVEVLFTLLEKSSEVSDLPNNLIENSMHKAAAEIRKTIDASQLVILVRIGGNHTPDPKLTITRKLVALPGTVREVTRDDGSTRGTHHLTGYSSGDMAGLAFGMLLVGGLAGYGALYYSSRK